MTIVAADEALGSHPCVALSSSSLFFGITERTGGQIFHVKSVPMDNFFLFKTPRFASAILNTSWTVSVWPGCAITRAKPRLKAISSGVSAVLNFCALGRNAVCFCFIAAAFLRPATWSFEVAIRTEAPTGVCGCQLGFSIHGITTPMNPGLKPKGLRCLFAVQEEKFRVCLRA